MRGEDQMESKGLGVPPSAYCKQKKLLLDLAKLFALKHGYKLVTSKNDHRRVILLCSRHGKGQATQGHYVSEESKRESKCDCPFKLELQFKARKDLWLMKPVTNLHNHDSFIRYPVSFPGANPVRIEQSCSSQVGHLKCLPEDAEHYFNAEKAQSIDGVTLFSCADETPCDPEVSETISPEEEPASFADLNKPFKDHLSKGQSFQTRPFNDQLFSNYPADRMSSFRVEMPTKKPKLAEKEQSLGTSDTTVMIKYSSSLELAINTLTNMARQVPKENIRFSLSYESQLQRDLEIVVTTSGVLEMEHKINLAEPDIAKSLPALISMITTYHRG